MGLYNTNSHLRITAETQFGGDALDFALLITDTSDAFYPISPYKIGYLLREVLVDQGADALIVPGPYYEYIAQQVTAIQEKSSQEFSDYARAYIRYASRVSSIFLFRTVFSTLKDFAFCGLLITGTLLAVAYLLHPSPHWAHGPQDRFIIAGFIACIVVRPLVTAMERLVPHGLRRAHKSIEPAEVVLHRRLSREFRAAAVDLIRATHERRLDPVLHSDRAPTLVEIESTHVLPSETFDKVGEFLRLHITSTIGIAGQRGSGKSTLLRWLAYDLEPDWVAVYLPAPTTYNAADFARTIFRTTVNSVLNSGQTNTVPLRYRVLSALTRASATDDIGKLSEEVLDLIEMARTDQWNAAFGLSGKGVTAQRQRQTTVARREPTHPELTAAFAAYLERYRRLGGKRIVIAIDELDKMANTNDAISVVNNLKELFHLPNTHFVVSVSEDALARYAMRGIPFRDVFDSAFDEIVQLGPPSPEEAWKLLAYRASGFPISIALFCYAWSGGLPRDLIRTARACVNVRRQLHRPAAITELAVPVIHQDVRAAVEAALTASLETNNSQTVDFLLRLRRRVEAEFIPLDNLLKDVESDAELTTKNSESHVVELQRLTLYIELGTAISDLFTHGIDDLIAFKFNKILEVTEMLAGARLALAVYPSEAKRLLSQATKAIEASRGS